MDKLIDNSQDKSKGSTNNEKELKKWETPNMTISNIENITEGGGFPPASGDDGFYVS